MNTKPQQLPLEERIKLVEDLWDSIATDQQALRRIANRFSGDARRPSGNRPRESTALPSIRVASGEVRRHLCGAGQRLPELVSCAEQPLSMRCSGRVEFGLARIRLIRFQSSLSQFAVDQCLYLFARAITHSRASPSCA